MKWFTLLSTFLFTTSALAAPLAVRNNTPSAKIGDPSAHVEGGNGAIRKQGKHSANVEGNASPSMDGMASPHMEGNLSPDMNGAVSPNANISPQISGTQLLSGNTILPNGLNLLGGGGRGGSVNQNSNGGANKGGVSDGGVRD